ncbi:MAG: ATP-binding protein [Candidatus Dormibacteria bacterium]
MSLRGLGLARTQGGPRENSGRHLEGLQLRLDSTAENLSRELDGATKEKISTTQVLEGLFELGVGATQIRRQRGRLRLYARCPVHNTLADFDFDFQPNLGRKVILLGPPGVGKTHLAIALRISATEAGCRTHFTSAADRALTLEPPRVL